MNLNKEYIGFFDSGIGGLSVVKEVRKKSPNLDIIYFGDNLNNPYGQKNQNDVIKLTKKAFILLKEKKCQKIVTACNSVSAVVSNNLIKKIGMLPNDFIEMSGATIDHCLKNKFDNILILSTELTKKSLLYTEKFLKNKIIIKEVAINGLVELIENEASEKEKENIIKESLKNVDLQKYQNIILACTHFPLENYIFKKIFLESGVINPNFLNPAVFVADKVFEKFGNKGSGDIKLIFSKNSIKTENLARKILN